MYGENRKEIKHPAFGMAVFHRVHGQPGNLFGSSVDCDQYIQLEILHGVEVEDESYHTFTADSNRPLITVAFSPAQFADLLTTMNIGFGTPCTIRDFNGEQIEEIPDEKHVNELDRQRTYFKEKMKEHTESLDKAQARVKELCSQSRLTKAEREELQSVLYKSIQDVKSNIPFYMKLFQEGTDEIVQHAKAEIDATVQHCVLDAGIKALGEKFEKKQIENKQV